ncbi:primosomal protein N' [Salinarimonas ramus]|uniref:Replication restart protein PriA n=1 Tax=Salinarimonas ramus TaxID=690164 RepID=A0A917Q5R4_9HYPH|nr:primosomal protein N' [Salinarimonas ramus]GGK26751.1 primosomal protein N' [Salinarimonas ramus]
MPQTLADVLVPLPLDTLFSYRVPDGMTLVPGQPVRVPFGQREAVGVVWGLRAGEGSNLKVLSGPIEAPLLPDPLRALLDFVAHWTLAPRGAVLPMALKLADPDRPETTRVGVRPTGTLPRRMTPARERVLAAIADGAVRQKRDLALEAGVSAGVVDGLVDEGVLETLPLIDPKPPAPDPDHAPAALSDAQRAAACALAEAVRETASGVPAPVLLEGVTGSGKTEAYFEAIAEALRMDAQSLVLMPEIALTSTFLDRFAARFGARPAAWHSGVTGKKRERLYADIASGAAKVIVGARSALFLPYAKLRLVVVDEEHDAGYKQEDGVHYHARDMAVMRARLEPAALVLASATPSLETRVNAERGRYRHLRLPERFGGRTLPQIAAVDMRKDGPPQGRWIAPPLAAAMEAALARGEQALLFLNRRGFAPLTLCRACGHRYECPNCTAWLVEHRFRRALVCHHCGHVERTPSHCPSCGGVDTIVPCGPGVERIAEEAAALFPEKRVITLSSDFPGGAERLRAELDEIASGACDIVIGTQLVAKGHNFPLLSVVGVVDADLGLTSGDPRAAERTFQLLQQVTGRAGRGDRPGRAYLQTYQPGHPVIAALLSGDAERFYAEETAQREAARLPPFGRLAALVVSGTDKDATHAHARALVRAAHAMGVIDADLSVLGPAEAPIAVIRGRHRVRILVRAARTRDLQGFLRDWLAAGPRPKGNIRVQVDVDPQSFL